MSAEPKTRADVDRGPRTEPASFSVASTTGRRPANGEFAGISGILGSSPSIAALRRDVVRVACSAASTVLILGESGTGKELIARSIHQESSRAAHRFIAVNCSAIPATLLEAEFFGHEAGAFTDARKRKLGLLEAAHGGTLFLDEIGELDHVLQAKFLRFLEERTIRRLGGTQDVAVDVRFMAATNVDLGALAQQGRFRSDLYYRLQVVTLSVPALRERASDIQVIARHFLEQFATRFHKSFEGFSVGAMRKLVLHQWPGNVRELRNAIERVVLLEDGPIVHEDGLVLGAGSASTSAPRPPPEDDLDLERIELRALIRALERTGGTISQAARLLGVSRDTVRYRIKKYGIRVETRVSVERPD